jgi:phosphinothricin acetyltransferase
MTVYVAADATGKGIGTALYRDLFPRLAKQDVHRALAGITLPNPASLALHARFGFRQVAHFTENGRKLGRYWDVVWWEKEM